MKYFDHPYILEEALLAKLPETKEVIKDIIWVPEGFCGYVPVLKDIEPEIRKKIEKFIEDFN